MANSLEVNRFWKIDTASQALVATGKTVPISMILFIGGAAGNTAVLTDGNDKEIVTLKSNGNTTPPVYFEPPLLADGLKIGTLEGGTLYVYLARP